MAVTGHKTVEMVSHYTRQADQMKLARAAVVRLDLSNSVKPAKNGSENKGGA
jgi:hypothetical protein